MYYIYTAEQKNEKKINLIKKLTVLLYTYVYNNEQKKSNPFLVSCGLFYLWIKNLIC